MSESFRFNVQFPFADWASEEARWGNRLQKGRYVNKQITAFPEWGDILRWQMGSNPRGAEKKADKFRPDLVEGSSWLNASGDYAVWLGHASFYISVNGVRMIVDPVLRSLPMIPRKVGMPCPMSDITGLDYILLSHGHRDHLDTSSLKALLRANPRVQVLTGLDIGKDLSSLRFREVQEAGWYQQYQLDQDLTITYLPAHHWNRRFLTDMNRNLWGAFMLEGGGKRLYFAGDSAYLPWIYEEIGANYDSIDLALMPIGAYEPDFIMKNSHMNPEEAAQAFRDTGASRIIPMHYGTFDLSDEPAGDPVRRIRKAVSEEQLVVPAVGQLVEF